MFSGAFTALVTPFRNGEVDVEALEGMVEFQIHNGVHGLVPCGTTGETPAMSEEEDRVVISTVVRVANGRVPVIAGSGSKSTDMDQVHQDGRRSRGRRLAPGRPLLQQADPGGVVSSLRHHSREHGSTDHPLQHPWPYQRDNHRRNNGSARGDPQHRGDERGDALDEHGDGRKAPVRR